jgi:hypothetical protein
MPDDYSSQDGEHKSREGKRERSKGGGRGVPGQAKPEEATAQ